jgi:isopenicillin N synthase-like dioxygenase
MNGGEMSARPGVPVIDLATLEAGDEARLGDALAEFGFFILEGHGVPREHWERAYRASARVFGLPDAIKARYQMPADGSQRGYSAVRDDLGDGRAPLDRKEAWNLRRPGHRLANVFPREVPEFGAAMLALVAELDGLAARILRGIGAFLGKPPGYFEEMVLESDSLFRVNHYPDFLGEQRRLRFRAHRDFDLVTLLLGATRPGLEIETRSGSWLPITPSADAIVVNVGDLLAVESRGRLPSTVHRVVTPEESDGGRISIVYFVSPRPEIVLANGSTAGEIIDDRLRDAGYLKSATSPATVA